MQFAVPQFIDVEDKIFGPITTRQFIILLAGGALFFVAYKLLTFGVFVFVGLIIIAASGTMAFMRVNGQPFHFFILNLLQTLRRPRLRMWNKTLTPTELRELTRAAPPPPPPSAPTRERPTATRLRDLALTVNTGGVYKSET